MRRGNILLIGIFAIVLAVAGFVVAESHLSLEDELAQLEQELTDDGYLWLVDYSQIDLKIKKSILYTYTSTENNYIYIILFWTRKKFRH